MLLVPPPHRYFFVFNLAMDLARLIFNFDLPFYNINSILNLLILLI